MISSPFININMFVMPFSFIHWIIHEVCNHLHILDVIKKWYSCVWNISLLAQPSLFLLVEFLNLLRKCFFVVLLTWGHYVSFSENNLNFHSVLIAILMGDHGSELRDSYNSLDMQNLFICMRHASSSKP